MRKIQIRDHVIYADAQRVEHDALVTTIWSPDCINVVYVSGDETKTDNYGRQIARETSVSRFSENNCFGRSFREVGTPTPEYRTAPAAS